MKNKKKNSKGFTLIELLAVVVILMAISVIAISSISAAIERNKVQQDDTKKKIISGYAQLYYDEHKNVITRDLNTNGASSKYYYNCQGGGNVKIGNAYKCMCIPISELDLDDKEKENADGEAFSGKACSDDSGASFTFN